MSHLLQPGGPTPTSRSYTPHGGKGTCRPPLQTTCQSEVWVPSACPTFGKRPPPCRSLPPGVWGQVAAPASRGRKLREHSERSRSRSHPELAALITAAGNACPERAAPGPFNWRLSEQVATSTPPALPRVPGQLARAGAGGESRERWGPGSARSPAPRGAHRESAAGRGTPGRLGAPRRGGTQGAPGAPSGLRPRPGPPHTQ